MITPPSPLRETIIKTVGYIKKNGASFEEKLKLGEVKDKFSFIDPENIYHEFYKKQLEGDSTATPDANEPKKEPKQEIKEPEPFRFLTELPPISAYDLNVLKLTALYVAVNTPKHASALQRHMNKIGNRSQFAFLNKGHSLQPLFQKYVDQYGLIMKLTNSAEETEQIAKRIEEGKSTLYQRAYERAVYEKQNKIERKSRETEEKNRQLHFALIDWQDFKFIAKINFDAIDEVSELPVPVSREDIVYRSLQAKSKEVQVESKPAEPEKQEEAQPEPKKEETPELPKFAGMKVKAAGESRLKKKNKSSKNSAVRTIKCPITGEQIPENEFDNHLKGLLRDPRYQEQQDNFMRKNFTHASNLTSDQVYENIKRLVRKRDFSEEEEAHKQQRIQ